MSKVNYKLIVKACLADSSVAEHDVCTYDEDAVDELADDVFEKRAQLYCEQRNIEYVNWDLKVDCRCQRKVHSKEVIL